MKNNNKSFLLTITIIVVLFLLSMIFLSFSNKIANVYTNNIHNNVTNEITNKIVSYEELNIEDVDQALQLAIKKVESAVIGVSVKALVRNETDVLETNYAHASGVIYKAEEIYDDNHLLVNYLYYAFTNAHVVNNETSSLIEGYHTYAYLGNIDLEINAEVLGFDAKSDVAVIAFYYSGLIEPVEMVDNDTIKKGQLCFAIGNPYSYDYYGSATFGIISSPLRYVSTDTDGDGVKDFYAEYIQHDVAINAGNSGGGLFNLEGKLIGINSMKIVADKIENMGFSIPSNICYTICEEYLVTGKEIIRPKLNIFTYEIRSLSEAQIVSNPDILEIPNIYDGEKPYGVYVSMINEGTISSSPIQVHDIILQINGIKITRNYILTAKLNSLVEGYKVGETVTLTYYDHLSKSVKEVQVILKA